jgi:lysophospholipid acyltransferase (LPLAT)-like uncharacterized protein
MSVAQSSLPKKRAGGVIIPNQPRWHQRLAASLLVSAIRVVAATIRFRWRDFSGFSASLTTGPAIYCFWHNRLALCTAIHQRDIKPLHPPRGTAGLVSASRDGAFLADVLYKSGVQPVRGSSSRRGPQALLELTSWAERGYDLAITPDGPRGPRYTVQEGVIYLAQLSGLPIIPISCHLNWKVQAGTWDRFQIPLPFTRCEIAAGKPIRVARDTSDPEREALRQQLEQTLRSLSKD